MMRYNLTDFTIWKSLKKEKPRDGGSVWLYYPPYYDDDEYGNVTQAIYNTDDDMFHVERYYSTEPTHFMVSNEPDLTANRPKED
jgi:hypothetical protein